MTPKATLISREIQLRLQQITTANGYLTNLGVHVYRGRAALYRDQSARPYACLISSNDEPDPESRRRAKLTREYTLVITLDAAADYDEHQDALLYDVRRALSYDLQANVLGGLALRLDLGTATLDDPELGSDVAQITLPISIEYGEVYPPTD